MTKKINFNLGRKAGKQVHLLRDFEARKFWEALRRAREKGNEVDVWHFEPLNVYGGTQIVIAKRLSTCRACGNKIMGGEKCLEFGWDWSGSGSYTAIKGRIHMENCIDKAALARPPLTAETQAEGRQASE